MARKANAGIPNASVEIKTLCRLFEQLRYRHDAMTVYSDFVAMAAISISNAVNFDEERENEYLRIVKKYSKGEGELFPKMFAAIVQQMQNDYPSYRDVLGELFMTLELGDSWKGQFFTPQCVCDLMARVTNVGLAKQTIEQRGYVTALEPCVGGGATVLGLVNAMFNEGLNPCKQLLVTAYDLDIRCVYMSYIQLSLAGIPAVIQQRNTLTNKEYSKPFYTPVYVIDRWAQRLCFKKAFEVLDNSASVASEEVKAISPPAEIEVVQPVQLTLF